MQSPCAHHAPNYTAQALRARGKRAVVLPHAFGLPAIFAGWTWCATRTASAAAASTAPTPMHSPTHRRLRQALRIQRRTARLLFTRPAWPRRALRSHDRQRAPRKLSAHAVALCSPCANQVPTILPRRYARRPRRTLRLHDCQRASRKLSVHAAALYSPCAHHAPHYIAQAARAPRRSSFKYVPRSPRKRIALPGAGV
jgi:hypothetical protein